MDWRDRGGRSKEERAAKKTEVRKEVGGMGQRREVGNKGRIAVPLCHEFAYAHPCDWEETLS